MGFLRRLFSASEERDEDDASSALAALESVQAGAEIDRAEAKHRLREFGRRHRRFFRFGADLHAAFRDAFEALHGDVGVATEAVMAVPWEDLGEEPDLRVLEMRVRDSRARYVVVRSDDPHTGAGASGELEAFSLLEREPAVALVLVGGLDLVLRRSFLEGVTAPARLPDVSEALMVFFDRAAAEGLDTRAVDA